MARTVIVRKLAREHSPRYTTVQPGTTRSPTFLRQIPSLQGSRRILIQQFDTLHPHSHDLLLRLYWHQLRDPALIPSLKKMLAGPCELSR